MKGKAKNKYKGIPIRLSADFSEKKPWRPEGSGRINLKWGKGKIYNQDCSTQQWSHSDLMEK